MASGKSKVVIGTKEEHLESELPSKLEIGSSSRAVASSSNSNNKIVLTSSDGISFVVKEVVARELQIIAHMIEDECASGNAISIANVTGDILSKVIEYCEKYVEQDFKVLVGETYEEKEAREKRIKIWGDEFVKPFKEDMPYLFQLIQAANYLSVERFLELTCRTVAEYITDKSPEECREIFNLENDFTPEEEAAILAENAADPFLN